MSSPANRHVSLDAAARALLEGPTASRSFPPNSRYHAVATAEFELSDGRKVVYLRRRFVPPPERFALLQEHTVCEGDRLDNLAAAYLGDPEQFWRLADANGAMRPAALVETVGGAVRITLPEGIPGPPDG